MARDCWLKLLGLAGAQSAPPAKWQCYYKYTAGNYVSYIYSSCSLAVTLFSADGLSLKPANL